MKISARSYLIAGVALASTGIVAVTPVVLTVTPYGSWIAGAQPADHTHRPGPGTGPGTASATGPGPATTASPVPSDRNNSSTSAVASQPNRSSLSQNSAVSGAGQASTGSTPGVVPLPSRVTTGVNHGTRSPRVTTDVQSFGTPRNRVTVAANGSIRPVATTSSVTSVSATSASAADSAPAPSPGRIIHAGVQRAMAGEASATAHANGSAGATVRTAQAPTGVPAAQPARSYSPYVGHHHH